VSALIITTRKVTAWFIYALAIYLGCVATPASAQRTSAGRDAGKYRSLIGRTYNATNNPPGLSTWENFGGSAVNEQELSDPANPELIVTGWEKGSSRIVTMQQKPQTSTTAKILDVIFIQKIARTDYVALSCTRFGETQSSWVAVAQRSDVIARKVSRAWYVDQDRLRFVRVETTGLACETDGP
jgi:hypothetical protein